MMRLSNGWIDRMASMLHRIRRNLGVDPPGRRIRVRADDVWLVSYPRSGNTWMRFMFTTALNGRVEKYAEVEATVPDIYRSSACVLDRTPSPRLLKSHEPFEPRYRSVIYLVRDPRDVAVSYRRFELERGAVSATEAPRAWIKRFVSGDVPFGDWASHVDGWLDRAADVSSLVLIRYEDLLADPRTQLQMALDVVGLQISPDGLVGAVEGSTLERMRQIQQREAVDHPSLVGSVARDGSREPLDVADRRVVEDAFGPTMERLGYRLGS